jgi:hypothetical protein
MSSVRDGVDGWCGGACFDRGELDQLLDLPRGEADAPPVDS